MELTHLLHHTPEQPEIERAFELDASKLPLRLDDYPSSRIIQRYLVLDEKGPPPFRIRSEDGRFFIAHKSEGTLTRGEKELPISREKAIPLWHRAPSEGEIIKIRTKVPWGPYLLQIDRFERPEDEGMRVEIEFLNEDAAASFIPLPWFGREITHDLDRKNSALSKKLLEDSSFPESARRIPSLRLPKEQGVLHAISELETRRGQVPAPLIVGISGGSASGKTSQVAHKIKDHFGGDALIISLDDYSRGGSYVTERQRRGEEINWDHPDYLDLDLAAIHLRELKQGAAEIAKPTFSFKTGERGNTEPLPTRPIIIVEGLFALRPEFQELLDYKIFVDVGAHGQLIRRLLRDVERTSMPAEAIMSYTMDTVNPMHREHVQPLAARADLIIENDYRAREEAPRIARKDFQMKFRGSLSEERLKTLGAVPIFAQEQEDIYYSSAETAPNGFQETLRLRKTGKEIIFSYKGPLTEDTLVRAHFTAQVTDKLEEKLEKFYTGEQVRVSKQRAAYRMGDIVICVDSHISIQRGGVSRQLPDHIEIQAPSFADIKDGSLLSLLAIDGAAGISDSYSSL